MKISVEKRVIALMTPLLLYFFIKSIGERNYLMSCYIFVFLLAGIYSIKIWLEKRKDKAKWK